MMAFSLENTVRRLLLAALAAGTGSAGCVYLTAPKPRNQTEESPVGDHLRTILEPEWTKTCDTECRRRGTVVRGVEPCVRLEPSGALRPTKVQCMLEGPDAGSEVGSIEDLEDRAPLEDLLTRAMDAVCKSDCTQARGGTQCSISGTTLSDAEMSCTTQVRGEGAGREPAGLRSQGTPLREGNEEGGYWARMAHFEAASVTAFERLAAELAHHGAPESLVRRAYMAAADERQHETVCRAMASRGGAVPERPEIAQVPMRHLAALAFENAREGCVRESFAALRVSWQGVRATNPAYAEVFAELGDDETRHGQLAWDIDVWVRTRLSDTETRELAAVHSRAAVELTTGALRVVPGPHALGLDGVAELQELARAFVRELTTHATA